MGFNKVGLSVKTVLFVSLFTLVCSVPVKAQSELTWAKIYKMVPQVNLLRNGSERKAQQNNKIYPNDKLSTKSASEARLEFNEKSLLFVGPKSIFFFEKGMRRYELPGSVIKAETILKLQEGMALVMVPQGGLTTEVQTDQGKVVVDPQVISQAPTPPSNNLPSPLVFPKDFQGAAFAVVTDGQKSNYYNFTPHALTIINPAGTQTVTLGGGQTVTVENGVIGEVQNFDLKKFYQTTKIAAVLAPGNEDLVAQEPESVQNTLRSLRKQAALAIENQELWVNGLCTLNSRGSRSTLSTNCITTDGDPIDKVEDVREVVTPRNPGRGTPTTPNTPNTPGNPNTPNNPNTPRNPTP